MRTGWHELNRLDQAVFWATRAFLNGRLEEQATVNWALRLKPNDTAVRLAVLDAIDVQGGREINEPWRSTWRLVEEYWNSPPVEESSPGTYHAQWRLGAGDRSGSLVAAIVELVSPRLSLKPFNPQPSLGLDAQLRSPRRRPKRVDDTLTLELTSGDTIDPGVLKLSDVTEGDFLTSLALALDGAVANGLDIARRLGWRGEGSFWGLGGLYRVYYVSATERDSEEEEPDEYHRGIAPSVKLLHTVVSRLAAIDILAATQFVQRWKEANSLIHLRLWAALWRDSHITSPSDVGEMLLSLGHQEFWNVTSYPEIAELRAKRFCELDPHQQRAITARIRRLPPRRLWPPRADSERIADARLYWALRELRRIEIAGASLPHGDKTWLDARIQDFRDLIQMARIDEGFMEVTRAHAVPVNPDNRFDLLSGENRLKMLEGALSSSRNGWDDDPCSRANDWIEQPGRPLQILADLESGPDGGTAFARVWRRFGWAHSPTAEQIEGAAQRDLLAEAGRVLLLLSKLPGTTILAAIEGISDWLSTWKRQVVALPQGLRVWLKVWPTAVEVTNARRPYKEELDASVVLQSSFEYEPKGPETLNTPAGKLVGVFLAACPNLLEDDHPFRIDGAPRVMRDTIIVAPAESGLIARHRMIESLAYFLKADPTWTREYLITPLTADNEEARTLWHAVARQRRSSEVLEIIGDAMVEYATDRRLGRETQRSLVFSLVVECLHALREQRKPAVAPTRITQMLRSLDDEIRASAAEVVQSFVHDNSAPRDGDQALASPEELFRSAGAPFLREVWPQERSLATPGVSKALADLPATTRDAFAEAVDAIERFLVPFECWTMLAYGLYGKEGTKPKLSNSDDQKKAVALLRLLDLTIGKTEASVIPHDLADALDQIGRISPKLTATQEFRRLATAARR